MGAAYRGLTIHEVQSSSTGSGPVVNSDTAALVGIRSNVKTSSGVGTTYSSKLFALWPTVLGRFHVVGSTHRIKYFLKKCVELVLGTC